MAFYFHIFAVAVYSATQGSIFPVRHACNAVTRVIIVLSLNDELTELQCTNISDCTGRDNLRSSKMLPVCNVINYSINFLHTVATFLFTLVALLENQDGVLSPKHVVQFMNVVNNCTPCHCMHYSSTGSKTPQTCLYSYFILTFMITHTHLFGSNEVRKMLTSSHQA